MGLAAVFGTVKSMDGAIDVYSEVGQGTTFRLYLPVEEQVAEQTEPSQGVQTTGGGTLILVIDDEEIIRNIAEEMLSALDYRVHAEKNGEVGLEYFRNHWQGIDLVILDMVMPKMNGAETYRAMRKINPDVKVLLASGYSINGAAQELLTDGVRGFIQKPFQRATLSAKVAEVLQDAPE